MNCPYCQHKNHLEVDMHADGYSSTLLECSECGALLSLGKKTIKTIHGPTIQDQAAQEAIANRP